MSSCKLNQIKNMFCQKVIGSVSVNGNNVTVCPCRQEAVHLEEPPSSPEGQQLPHGVPGDVRLHCHRWRHRRLPTGGDAVPQVQGAAAGERRLPVWQPQRLLHGELPHRADEYGAGLAGAGLHLHRRCHQCPGKGVGRWHLYQCWLLQPGQLKVCNALDAWYSAAL